MEARLHQMYIFVKCERLEKGYHLQIIIIDWDFNAGYVSTVKSLTVNKMEFN